MYFLMIYFLYFNQFCGGVQCTHSKLPCYQHQNLRLPMKIMATLSPTLFSGHFREWNLKVSQRDWPVSHVGPKPFLVELAPWRSEAKLPGPGFPVPRLPGGQRPDLRQGQHHVQPGRPQHQNGGADCATICPRRTLQRPPQKQSRPEGKCK